MSRMKRRGYIEIDGEHPAKIISEPSRVPDYSDATYDAWFKEKVLISTDQRYGPSILDVCPITGQLMYMPAHFPLQWQVLSIAYGLQEAYVRYVMERDMLGAQDKQEKV